MPCQKFNSIKFKVPVRNIVTSRDGEMVRETERRQGNGKRGGGESEKEERENTEQNL